MWISLVISFLTGHTLDTRIEFIKFNLIRYRNCNIKDFVLLYRCIIKILSGHKINLEERLWIIDLKTKHYSPKAQSRRSHPESPRSRAPVAHWWYLFLKVIHALFPIVKVSWWNIWKFCGRTFSSQVWMTKISTME